MPTRPRGPVVQRSRVRAHEKEKIKKRLDAVPSRGNLVKWKGYDDSHTSWEPARNVANAPALIADFHRKNPNTPCRLNAATFGGLNFQPMPSPLTEARCRSGWEMGKGTSHEVMRH
ncbi:hypothetical protein POSPLADRAFT_1061757 [Postia placenta MAD-698-R-SB12]|uniref:Chromo domain-containing protein n=1 Tax=Postia placenta MAD-698-R-SB12 TaxID=670580 RepID=A0A1X6MM65_9APHY|nr:hypothetical protein POSPLADRAFT_1061757 [Postia placenta MAD-698-R-SB12]OSX57521.1 hypothetical protein POSPLADRAFT_1061757 [Postia placenta MAD-698-R-SB12]